jgi:hypothetical protein
MSDHVSASFSAENEKRALELLAELKALFPFGIKLSGDQKKSLLRLDDGRLPFVEKGLLFGKQQPKIVPPFTDLDELAKDFALNKSLKNIELEISSLTEIISDTRAAAGADAYQASLSIYQSAKGAAKNGIPGSQTIVDEMGKLFTAQGNRTAKATSDQSAN